MQGVPLRIGVGPRDVAAGSVELTRRDTGWKDTVMMVDLPKHVERLIPEIQAGLLAKNESMRKEKTVTLDNYDEFKKALDE